MKKYRIVKAPYADGATVYFVQRKRLCLWFKELEISVKAGWYHNVTTGASGPRAPGDIDDQQLHELAVAACRKYVTQKMRPPSQLWAKLEVLEEHEGP